MKRYNGVYERNNRARINISINRKLARKVLHILKIASVREDLSIGELTYKIISRSPEYLSAVDYILGKTKQQPGGVNMSCFQQGDVIIEDIDCLPDEVKKLDNLILRTGEVTGHTHKVTSGLAELFEAGSTKYLNVLSEEATVTHEEHNPIVLPKGTYKISIVREYDHFTEEARELCD